MGFLDQAAKCRLGEFDLYGKLNRCNPVIGLENRGLVFPVKEMPCHFKTLDTHFADQDQGTVTGLENPGNAGPVGLGMPLEALTLVIADQQGAGHAGEDDAAVAQQIGRASCRERV